MEFEDRGECFQLMAFQLWDLKSSSKSVFRVNSESDFHSGCGIVSRQQQTFFLGLLITRQSDSTELFYSFVANLHLSFAQRQNAITTVYILHGLKIKIKNQNGNLSGTSTESGY